MLSIIEKVKQFLNNLFKKFGKDANEVDYICGGAALPMPLVGEEEQAHLRRATSGDTISKKLLIEHNLRLVVYIVKKFDNVKLDNDDLISVGTIGLIKAINSFSLEKNIKLATYASRCIENEILMYMRKMGKSKNDVSLEEPLNVDFEGNELLLCDILGTEPDIVSKDLEKNVEHDLLRNCISNLKDRDKFIIECRFGLFGKEEKTQKEVADMMNISQSYISRLEKKILARLKKQMEKVY